MLRKQVRASEFHEPDGSLDRFDILRDCQSSDLRVSACQHSQKHRVSARRRALIGRQPAQNGEQADLNIFEGVEFFPEDNL